VVRTFDTQLPGCRSDPLLILWLMHWYKGCLTHGRLPYLCPNLQYPVGAHLGTFSPLQFQALLYLPLSCLTANDVLCYNLIWIANLVFTGIGSCALAWHVLRDRASAVFAGLLGMLAGPVLLHAHGHLELITLGWVPLFVGAWLRGLDTPNRRTLFRAASLYVLVALSAAYFAVFAIVPAVCYVIGQMVRAGRQGALLWLCARLGWLCSFAALTAPCLIVLFSSQLLSQLQGYSLPRPKEEFNYYGAPLWSSAVPSPLHPLHRLLPADPYAPLGAAVVECCSYLGLVPLALIGYAALSRAAFPRRRYWWWLFAVLTVLSFGAYWQLGHLRICLPAEWLRKTIPVFRLVRVPARFNLLAGVCGAVLAGAGLRQLLARLGTPSARIVVWSVLGLLALADLAQVPFPTAAVPRPPACYEFLRATDPSATFLEVPQFYSNDSSDLAAACMYWQTCHGGTTTAGYSCYSNVRYENLVSAPSPFARQRLEDAAYLAEPESLAIDLVSGVRAADYVWLYLTAHRLDYVIVHREPAWTCRPVPALDRLRGCLRQARILEDAATEVYARSLLERPRRPVLLCTTGWRQRSTWNGKYTCATTRQAQLTVYNPLSAQPLVLQLEAAALHAPRTVRLLAGTQEVARWEIVPQELHTYRSPPISLPEGLSELVLASDGADRPLPEEVTYEGDTTPFSLRVAGLVLVPADPSASVASMP
jgi:hypothetical protein